ncbi:MAG: DUF2089 domain-containing protein [bacterium]|nr:DUF2089 domain-containing protein [bacterium]
MKHILCKCPACNKAMTVRNLRCNACDISIEGDFAIPRLAQLDKKDVEFIELFVLASGSLKELEKKMNISYPTVRNRLNKIIDTLKYNAADEEKRRKEILDELEKGKISAEKAASLLKGEH